MYILGINVRSPPRSLFLFLLFGVQKEVAEDFISVVEGETSSLGGPDHASGLHYHHEGVFNLCKQIFVEGLPCAKFSSRHKIELGEEWINILASVCLKEKTVKQGSEKEGEPVESGGGGAGSGSG